MAVRLDDICMNTGIIIRLISMEPFCANLNVLFELIAEVADPPVDAEFICQL